MKAQKVFNAFTTYCNLLKLRCIGVQVGRKQGFVVMYAFVSTKIQKWYLVKG